MKIKSHFFLFSNFGKIQLKTRVRESVKYGLMFLISIAITISSFKFSIADESTEINSIIKSSPKAQIIQKSISEIDGAETEHLGTQISKEELVKTGTTASVFIIAINENAKDNKVSLGTGFFVQDDLIFTNAHVVENADQIFAIDSEAQHYTLKKIAVGDSQTGTDFAIIQTDKVKKQRTLSLNITSKQLHDVYAFGFPGNAIEDDPTFLAIRNGDKLLAPNIVISNGTVQAIRDNYKNIETIIHSAKIAPGSSGGPLLNSCGQVVGINTYLRNENAEVQTVDGKIGVAKVDAGYSFSLSSNEIVQFLKKRKIELKSKIETCS